MVITGIHYIETESTWEHGRVMKIHGNNTKNNNTMIKLYLKSVPDYILSYVANSMISELKYRKDQTSKQIRDVVLHATS